MEKKNIPDIVGDSQEGSIDQRLQAAGWWARLGPLPISVTDTQMLLSLCEILLKHSHMLIDWE